MNDQDRVRLDRIDQAVTNLNVEVVALKEEMTSVTTKVDKVYYAITGNELDGNRGIVYRLQRVEEMTNKVERDFDRLKWSIIAWGAGAGILGSGASSMITRLFGS
jgi:hypothetical protein